MAIPNMSRRSLHSDGNSFIGSNSNSQTSNQSSSKESYSEGNGTMTSNELKHSLSVSSSCIKSILCGISCVFFLFYQDLAPSTKFSDSAGQSVVYKRKQIESTTRREYTYDNSIISENRVNEKYVKFVFYCFFYILAKHL